MSEVPSHLDGNAAAGVLADIFCADVTASVGECTGCGQEMVIAQAHAYMGGPGLVLRCPGCAAVLLRVVRTPARTWLDMTGLRSLVVAGPAPA